MSHSAPPTEHVCAGLAVSSGVAMGVAFRCDHGALAIPDYTIAVDAVEEERKRLADAVAVAVKQVRKLKTKAASLPDAVAEELGVLLDARLQMLSNSRLVRGADRRIAEDRKNAEAAVKAEVQAVAAGFAQMGDSYLAARAADVREVGDRLLRNLLQQPFQSLKSAPPGSVVIAEELSPADTALLDPTSVVAFATCLGGPESHTAIMARSLGIPAVLGAPTLLDRVRVGDTVIVDGDAGRVIVNPDPETAADYARRVSAIGEERRRLSLLRDLPAVTRDGLEVNLFANLELPREFSAALAGGAVGVGLFRTEFMFMNRETAPSEEEQYALLRTVVEGMNGLPVTIRTLDIGGDKLAPSLREQLGEPMGDMANPALGVRGVRLSLNHPRLFETQLAAILRAAAHGPVRILLPMVSSASQMEVAKMAILRVVRRLRRRHAPLPTVIPPLGAMIEIPGAALNADGLASVCDFFAIGTNDLTMYTLAIDRGEERVAALYNPLHPSVLRLIQFTVAAGLRARIPVSVCGEIAGDPRYTALLLGMGVRDFSMAAPKLPRVKQRLRQIDSKAAIRRAQGVLDQWDERRIIEMVEEFNLALALERDPLAPSAPALASTIASL